MNKDFTSEYYIFRGRKFSQEEIGIIPGVKLQKLFVKGSIGDSLTVFLNMLHVEKYYSEWKK